MSVYQCSQACYRPCIVTGCAVCDCCHGYRYKGSMDARTFQQHSARVAELTDALLADRAANKAAQTLNAESDTQSPASDALPSSDASPNLASPQSTPSVSPDKAPAGDQNGSHQSALPGALRSQQAGSHSGRETAAEQQRTHASLHASPDQGYADQAGLPALTRDSVLSASSSTSASAGQGRISQALPATDGLAGSLGGSRGSHYCTICNVSTTSAVHLQTHYMGSKHQRRLAQVQNSADRDSSPHYCAVCGISATSAVHLQLHLNGRAHQRKAKLASEAGPDLQGSHHSPAALVHNPDPGTAQRKAAC